MNRPIKFRAWDGKEMQYQFRIHSQNNTVTTFQEEPSAGNVERDWIPMQFTGLLDKNGREVYEGDVFKCSSGCPHAMEWRGAHAFGDMGGWKGSELGNGYDWIGIEEVIGNIYENPELRLK